MLLVYIYVNNYKYMVFLSLTIKKIAFSRVMLLLVVKIRISSLWELILMCVINIDDLLAIVKYV
jgi:hypothetical protein